MFFSKQAVLCILSCNSDIIAQNITQTEDITFYINKHK